MTFEAFVRQNSAQENPHLRKFVNFLLKDTNFPKTSDPIEMSLYLYKLLGPEQTLGFQKWLMLYKSTDPENKLPLYCKNEKAFLDAINTIVRFQNTDAEYKKKYNLKI